MRKSLTVLVPVLAAFASSVARADDPVPQPLVMVNATELFVPDGFDDNDEALAVVDGYLPNTCYRLAFNETHYDAATNSYHVIQWARVFPGICLQIVVPFFTEARLGVLHAGDYTVKVRGVTAEPLSVAESHNEGPDDYLYAPVDNVRVEKDPTTGELGFIIEGRFTNTCMGVDEIRVVDSGKTLAVLPIAKWQDRPDCAAAELPFVRRVALPADMAPGRHLLHVRSLNGKSLNTVFGVGPNATL